MTWTKRLQIENKRLSFCRAYSVGWVVFFNFSQKLHVEKALAQFQSHFKFSKMYKKWLLTFVYRWAGCPTDTIEQGFVVLNLICVRKLMGPNDSAKFKSLASILNILNRSVITKFSEHQFQRTKCHKSPIQECNNTLFANSQLRWNVYSNKKHVHTNKSLCVFFIRKTQLLKVWLYAELRKGWLDGKAVASYGNKNETETSPSVISNILIRGQVIPCPNLVCENFIFCLFHKLSRQVKTYIYWL